ncbi:hypothetical protein BTN49_1162 [Candidatus Enterovibrio escicola]|uniref:Mobile element protein n=1 Tax=Candidatus Enterovibrio escicola TaxID=1927127 RepID=A0A2A5T4U4_9GAMM|nr:hypothetical protein BTN49_1162 [Candidatus Enterovibrio escacola]
MVKGIFKRPLHRLKSFLNSVFTLINPSTYTYLSNAFEDRKS